MELSECCDAPFWEWSESPICGECREHCDVYDDEGEE